MKKHTVAAALLCLCLLGSVLFGKGMTTEAKEASRTADFSGDVTVLSQNGNNYVMQVTVENSGEDFSGTVQLILGGDSLKNCAYSTQLTLPAQGRKQFTVTVPSRGVDTIEGIGLISFRDEDGQVLQSIPLKNIFNNSVQGIPVGILSDQYSDLTYLDAGGTELYGRNLYHSLALIELDASSLENYLDGLSFLVIDRFNTESLEKETIDAIWDWVNQGGCLMIGTGAYGEQTLSGFREVLPDIKVLDVSEAGETNHVLQEFDSYGNYSDYINAGVDFSAMQIAELDYNYQYCSQSAMHPAIYYPVKYGAVAVFYCALSDPQLDKLSPDTVTSMYMDLLHQSQYYYYGNGEGMTDLERHGRRLLSTIEHEDTDVNFTWLQALIAGYVVLVGPLLYLVLRKCRKREWYWVCAPALGIVFIGGVFLFGHGMRVDQMKVCSVTIQRADTAWQDTYLLAYRSGLKEWDVDLEEDYQVAGPGFGNGMSGRTSIADADDYSFIVTDKGDHLAVGIKPEENFENGFLYAGKPAERQGIVINETGCDFAYLAVQSGMDYWVFSNVAAGETLDLAQALDSGRCVWSDSSIYFDDLVYHVTGFYDSTRQYEEYTRADMSALLLGIGVAGQEQGNSFSGSSLGAQDQVILAGLVKDYKAAATGEGSQISYGCLYSYAEAEVEQDASN